MKQVLDWLEDPAQRRGIHFAGPPDAEWQFRSYRELAGDAYRVAALFRDSGATRGDVVALMLGTAADFAPAFFGALIAGLTVAQVPSPQMFGSQDKYVEGAAHILRVAQPSIVVCDATARGICARASALAGGPPPMELGAVTGLPPAPTVTDTMAGVSVLQFTSGSAAAPKGVSITPGNLAANVEAITRWLRLTPEDSCSSWLPLYHDMGLVGAFLCSLVNQMDLWLMTPLDFIRSPLRWLECHGRLGVTTTTAPSFGYAHVARKIRPDDLAGMDFSRWRVAANGAERIDPLAAADFASLLRPFGFLPSAFSPCYGLAEATLVVSGVSPGAGGRMVRVRGGLRAGAAVEVAGQGVLGTDRPDSGAGWLASCGPPVSGTTVRVLDEDGAPLPAGHFGEIMVSGPSVAPGYHPLVPGTTSDCSPDGLRTGDSGFLLDDEIYVVGRIGDSVKIRGMKVHAEDVEAELAAIPGIDPGRCVVALGNTKSAPHAVAVVEAADTRWADSAVSVLRAATDETALLTVVQAARGAIPRTTSGKPRRRLVWAQSQEQRLAGKVVYPAGHPGSGLVLDITEADSGPGHAARLATSHDLYYRWERQQWSIVTVDPGRDRAVWQTLTTFMRQQLLTALAELEVGEETVTRTLGAMTDHPPTEDDRIFLCTQMADEARHARFFQAYLRDACGVSPAEQEGQALAAAADFAQVFTPKLASVTAAARDGDDPGAWYRALVYYHLIGEGVLAATALRSTASLARRLNLSAFAEGLTNVTRDESRHVSFGVRAAAAGVDSGYAQVIADTHDEAIGRAAWVLVGPSRYNPVPAIRQALTSRAAQLADVLDTGEQRLLKQLRLVGLAGMCERAADAWRTGVDAALDAYEDRWHAPHPIRAAKARAARLPATTGGRHHGWRGSARRGTGGCRVDVPPRPAYGRTG